MSKADDRETGGKEENNDETSGNYFAASQMPNRNRLQRHQSYQNVSIGWQ